MKQKHGHVVHSRLRRKILDKRTIGGCFLITTFIMDNDRERKENRFFFFFFREQKTNSLTLKLPLKYLFVVPILMGVLWTYRQPMTHLFFRFLAPNRFRSISMANLHVKALQSPYSGTTDVKVRFHFEYLCVVSHQWCDS